MSITHYRQKLVSCFDTTRIFVNHQYAQTQTVLSLNVILSNTCAALQAFRSIKEHPAPFCAVCGAHQPPIHCVIWGSAVGLEADHGMRGARPPFCHVSVTRYL